MQKRFLQNFTTHAHQFKPVWAKSFAVIVATILLTLPQSSHAADSSLKNLLAQEPTTFAEFIAIATPSHGKLPAASKVSEPGIAKPKTYPQLALKDLTDADLMTFGELVAKTSDASPSVRKHSPIKVAPSESPKTSPVLSSAQATDPALAPASIQVKVVKPKSSGCGTHCEVKIDSPVQVAATPPKTAPIVPASPVLPAQAPVQAQRQSVQIQVSPQGLAFEPKNLHFDAVGAQADVKIVDGDKRPIALSKSLALFVRDSQLLSWNKATMTLQSVGQGSTELYVVDAGRMHIVPVTIGAGAEDKSFLSVPSELLSLDGIIPDPLTKQAQHASMPGLPGDAPEANGASRAVSVNDSAAQASETLAQDRVEGLRFQRANQKIGYSQLTLQIIDERSRIEKGLIYPAIGVQVHLAGTEFVAESDGNGQVQLKDIPQGARLLVAVDDPTSTYLPAITEINTAESGSAGVIHLRVMRDEAFGTFASMARVVQTSGKGSFCATIVSDSGDHRGVGRAGASARIDVGGEGPYYFNHYGFLDSNLATTSDDGRLCFFNVEPGPITLSVDGGDRRVATIIEAVASGRHSEFDIDLSETGRLSTRIATMATAHEQLSSEKNAADRLRPIDDVNLIPLGTEDPLPLVEDGIVGMTDRSVFYHGRAFAVSQASEFEATVYSYALPNAAASNQQPVTPLVPRGFIEDMSVYAQVSHDSVQGVVMVEHGQLTGQGNGPVNFRLVDERGQDVGEGWYYTDQPATRAIFFNVPPGKYQLLVETSDHYWLAADTVMVFNEAVSYVQTGTKVGYSPVIH